jgi:hypothetical protein
MLNAQGSDLASDAVKIDTPESGVPAQVRPTIVWFFTARNASSMHRLRDIGDLIMYSPIADSGRRDFGNPRKVP